MQCSERLGNLVTHPAVLFPVRRTVSGGGRGGGGAVPLGTEQSGLGDRMMQAK